MRSRKTRFFSTAVLAIGMMTLLSSCPLAVVFVSFNDPALESIIKEKLGVRLTPVTSVDMLGLISLDISGVGINDITGLEYARNLQFLDASDNSISDLTPLDHPLFPPLVNLRTLNLEGNSVVDISPLQGLTGLSLVKLCENVILDLTPLVINSAGTPGFGDTVGDTLHFDNDLASGPAIDADLLSLIGNGVTVFLCSDSTPVAPAISVSGDFAFGTLAGTDSKLITITNTGGGTLIWGINEPSRPSWVTAVGPPTAGSLTAGTSTTVTVSIDVSGEPMGMITPHTLTIVSNGGADVVIDIEATRS